MNAHVDWHFPRRELTDQFLSTFASGVSNTLTLFAPRRMGKTEFILFDLIPEAHEQGYRPIYVSFWDNPRNPVTCLKKGLERSIGEMTWLERRRWANSHLGALKLGGEVGIDGTVKASAEVSGRNIPPQEDDLSQLRSRFETLLSGKRKILLCLDEVQHLATDRAFEPLVFFLRTLLDENRDKLYVVYTGSSRDGLYRLFNCRKAPLFRSSSQIDLPELGSGFVKHMLDAFDQATARTLCYTRALNAFHTLNRVPRDFRAVIEGMVLSGETDITSATERYRQFTNDANEYEKIWSQLKPIEQAILAVIAQNIAGPYHEDARRFIATWLGVTEPDVATHTIQNALNRLRGEFLAPVEKGVWVFEDLDFKIWVAEAFAKDPTER